MKILAVEKDSVLEEMGVQAGDRLLTINGKKIVDILDYQFLSEESKMLIEIEDSQGELLELDIEMGADERLGAIFDEEAISIKSCRNRCIFCFIDQMPDGMRPSLYVKDDDERMSFLRGNYITLTNLSQEDMARIVRYRTMPINISIHTTDDNLRKKMLGNRFAGQIMEKLSYFADNRIKMNGQIVLCPGYNDGKHLRRTLSDLKRLYPEMVSVSVVPVGLSKHRQGLTQIEPVSVEKAQETLAIIEAVQEEMKVQGKKRFVYPADELFLLAKQVVPQVDYYDGFPQIENGVGMVADFIANVAENLKMIPKIERIVKGKIGLITGTLAAPLLAHCIKDLKIQFKDLKIDVFAIQNDFFGRTITVSGLLTGKDICRQISQDHGMDYFVVPDNLLKKGEDLLLDDTTLEDLEEYLGVPVRVAAFDGHNLFRKILEE